MELNLEKTTWKKEEITTIPNVSEEYMWNDSSEGHPCRGTLLRGKEELLNLKTHGGEQAKRILLKGLPGSGKSSLLSKLAYDWSQNSDSPLNQYELVFLLRMNKLEENCNLIDAISKQIKHDESNNLKTYLEQNETKIMILMDSWDESSIQDISRQENYPGDLTIEQILSLQKLPKVLVIVSSRLHKPLGTVQSDYVPVNVKGFSYENMKTYISKFFHADQNQDSVPLMDHADQNQDLVDKMVCQVNSSTILQTIARIPVILMLLCHVWKYHQKFPDTLSCLYDKFLTTIWKRFKHTWENETDVLSEEFQCRLGKIALQGLLSTKIEDDIIEFPEDKFGDECDLGLKVGIITKGWKFTDEEESFISFLHKSVQEFLAGKYLANLFAKNEKEFHNTLDRIDSWKLVQQKWEVLKFCCGISGTQQKSTATAIIDHVIKKYDDIHPTSDVFQKHWSPSYRCNSAHHVPVEFHIGVGMTLMWITYRKATDILPLLILFHEAQSDGDAILHFLSTSSVFSKSLSVSNRFIIYCNTSYPALQLFYYFLKSTGKTALNIKSIRFHSVNSLESILDILNYVPNLELLELPIVSMEGKSAFGKSVAALPNLSTLKFKGTISDMSDLCDLLSLLSRSSPKSLTHHIDLSSSTFAISDIGAVMTSHLTCLILRKAHLEESHIKILSGHLPDAQHLRLLDLSHNEIGDINSISALTQNLKYCQQMQRLRLANTNLKQKHIETLIDFLSSWPAKLLELDLSANDVGDAFSALRIYLQQSQQCKQMQLLNLCSCLLKEDHISTIKAALPQTLLKLDFSVNVVGDSLTCLINSLQHCEQLTILNLQDTHLTDEGVVALGQHLHHWCHLSELGLFDNDVGNSGLHSVLTHLHHLSKLTWFNISATIDSSCSTLVRDCVHVVGKEVPEGRGEIGFGDYTFATLKEEHIQSILSLSKAASKVK